MVFILMLYVNFMAIGGCILLYFAVKKWPKKVACGILIIAVAVHLWANNSTYANSCEEWGSGLNHTHISIEGSLCKVFDGKFCFLSATDSWFDMPQLTRQESCSAYYGEQYYNDVPYINWNLAGFPRTQEFSYFDRDETRFPQMVLDNMIQITDTQDIEEKGLDVVLNHQGDKPKIEINIVRNKAVVQRSFFKERFRPRQSMVNNVLAIFVDSISRAHFHRKMKKTVKWLEKYYNSRTTTKESFQFFRYHAVKHYTAGTMIPVYFGVPEYGARGVEITKTLKDQGFITAVTRNYCAPEHFDYKAKQYKKLTFEPFDHENTAMFCDPTFHLKGHPHSFFTGPYSSFRRCLYGRDTYEYNFEYGLKFWETYSDRPKFLELDFLDGHEMTGEVVSYMDEPLSQFLSEMDSKGYLEDTAIMLYSDHGLHLNFFYYVFNEASMYSELRLPTLFLVLPRNLSDSTPGNILRQNEQRLIGSFDLHNFLGNLVGGNDMSRRGKSLFESLSETRSCKDIFSYQCVCAMPQNTQVTNSSNELNLRRSPGEGSNSPQLAQSLYEMMLRNYTVFLKNQSQVNNKL